MKREQWLEMWESIDSIEHQFKRLDDKLIRIEHAKPIVDLNVKRIKILIQSVIGQME